MLFIDGLIRFSGVGLLILLAALAAFSPPRSKSSFYLILSCVSVAALFAGYTPSGLELPGPLHAFFRFLDVPHLVLAWLFGLSLFQAEFKPRVFHIVVGAPYCLPIFLTRFAQLGIVGEFPFLGVVIVDLMAFGVAAHLIFSALLGQQDDLLQGRRNARVYFAATIAFVTISAAAIEVVLVGKLAALLPTAKVAVIWPAIVWACLWLLTAKTDALEFKGNPPPRQPASDQDRLLNQSLMKLIVEDQEFRNPDLTIVAVAKRLAVTQHRLRSHINQHLGYTNFSSFINEYRLEAIKSALSGNGAESRSITSIALDNGFKSLSSFNRAFKSQVEQTPIEYRQKMIQSRPLNKTAD